MDDSDYSVPRALTILSGIFLVVGGLSALLVTVDIVLRKGWQSMMGIMIPVYILNASYLGPLALYPYYRFGRPVKPVQTPTREHADMHAPDKPSREGSSSSGASSPLDDPEKQMHGPLETEPCGKGRSNCCSTVKIPDDTEPKQASCCGSKEPVAAPVQLEQKSGCCSSKESGTLTDPKPAQKSCCASQQSSESTHEALPTHHGLKSSASEQGSPAEPACHAAATSQPEQQADTHACCHSGASTRPYWATVLVGVFHCGAGCMLGDLVGEWLVYGTNAMINEEMLWAALLIDYAFALLFGIVFQYFSIAPMSGRYGPMTVWRAAKADILSLTSFEIGAFGWMVIYQVAIWDYKLGMDTWLYWWMMQIGMAMGVVTAFPANWWLLKWKVKEPCC